MIVHLIYDDKFIDMACREFQSAAPYQNTFVLLGRQRPLKFVKFPDVVFHTVSETQILLRSPECKAVIFHSLRDAFLPLLKDIPPKKKVVWLGWGHDYYDRLLKDAFPDGLLLSQTKALMAQAPQPPKIRMLTRRIKRIARSFLARTNQYSPELLQRVDYFCPVIKPEYDMAIKLNPWFRSNYVSWNYGTLENDLSSSRDNKEIGSHILVGNSAAPENNHLEVFELLSRHVDLTDRKIIVPLSYGDEWYKQRIIEAGRQLFGGQFVPLTDFMPKDEYIGLLGGCGYVFMNHLRQQALGNICIMLFLGARVFMNVRSPLYTWLLEKGAHINSIGELANNSTVGQDVLTPLPQEIQQINISIVKKHWGRDTQIEKTRQLIKLVLGVDRLREQTASLTYVR